MRNMHLSAAKPLRCRRRLAGAALRHYAQLLKLGRIICPIHHLTQPRSPRCRCWARGHCSGKVVRIDDTGVVRSEELMEVNANHKEGLDQQAGQGRVQPPPVQGVRRRF